MCQTFCELMALYTLLANTPIGLWSGIFLQILSGTSLLGSHTRTCNGYFFKHSPVSVN